MALISYMKIDTDGISKEASAAKSIGQVAKGDSANNDKITVVGYSLGIVIPRDLSSGVATGTRNHQPVVFTKYVDKSSPLLWQALAGNKVLAEVVLECYRPDPSGLPTPELFYTVTWKNATLVEGKGFCPIVIDPANSFYQHMENWSFTYKEVQWDHKPGGTTGNDKW